VCQDPLAQYTLPQHQVAGLLEGELPEDADACDNLLASTHTHSHALADRESTRRTTAAPHRPRLDETKNRPSQNSCPSTLSSSPSSRRGCLLGSTADCSPTQSRAFQDVEVFRVELSSAVEVRAGLPRSSLVGRERENERAQNPLDADKQVQGR